MRTEHRARKTEPTLRKLAYGSVYRAGVDLAILIAFVSSTLDVVSVFLPWLVGINSVYTPGRGLTYTITVSLSAIDLLGNSPYLILLFLPPLSTIVLVLLSIRGEGLIPPRVPYQTKSRILLFLAGLFSMIPAFTFLDNVMAGTYFTPELGVFVSRWELGGAAAMPTYAGLGFFLALVLRIIKD